MHLLTIKPTKVCVKSIKAKMNLLGNWDIGKHSFHPSGNIQQDRFLLV